MAATTLTDAINAVADGRFDADLNGANLLAAEIGIRRRVLEARRARQFAIGTRVTFRGRRAESVVGTIEKMNRTTVTVRETGTDRVWRVSPSLLRLWEEK